MKPAPDLLLTQDCNPIRQWVRIALAVGTGVILALRVLAALADLRRGDETAFLALPLSVLMPALLTTVLLMMPPARTVEGALMRLGTAIHLTLILAVPPLALHLALGLPVVFLVVELFQTRMPARLRDPLTRMVLA